jgi:hypothetical protein
MKRVRGTLFVALGLAATACARSVGSSPSPFVERAETTIQITVDNQDFRDATLYLNWNGTRQRLGTVTGKTTRTLTTPWEDYQVRLAVDFLGGGEVPLGDPILVSPGEHIDFIIMPGW